MEIAIVGLGLIGGSLAKAIKKNTSHRVCALDINQNATEAALSTGTIDAELKSPEQLNTSDITIICLYPGDTIDFVRTNAHHFKKGSIVADTCGIKSEICETLVPIGKKNGFTFIGAHPMAGSEKSGFSASSAEMFDKASFIITSADEDDRSAETLAGIAKDIGFSQVVTTTPQQHDRIIALTSQLPHVLACAYILDPDTSHHRGFSGGSFRDVSRVAEINDRLWSELFIKNKDSLSEKINRLIINLQRLDDAIATSDYDTLSKLLQAARKKKEETDA